jgi:NADH-quinone oxidoreductase subunit G
MPKCTINGKEVEVKEGTSIIEAMNQSGDRIAHYCWHPGLSVAGVCRLCMVEIEGNPRVQIACNTTVTEGMRINNTSDKVKDAVKWGLDFHLINHPLDCPICDQAGECGLQDQYMEFGKYDPEMAEPKQKKHKVVDLGPTVVLDSERCILCSRCVRFTEEVSKTNELGIFNRGDRSEIGTHEGVQLDNKYSLNTVDICPVGALTSKDFRFRQRVWYLKDGNTICNGCSAGCNVKAYYNKEGFFRVKPIFNEQVNGHWMCDEGRNIYKFVNKEHRLLKAQVRGASDWSEMAPGAAAKDAHQVLKSGGAALVLTAQYTVEEFEAIVSAFVNEFKSKNIFYWVNNKESFDDFDGILIRGDKNPNTKGLLKILEKYGITVTWQDLTSGLANGSVKTVVVAGPENQDVYPDMADKIKELSVAQNLVWLQPGAHQALQSLTGKVWLIPTKTFVEKDGTFINHTGLEQKFKKVTTIVSEALTLTEAALLLSGKNLVIPSATHAFASSSQRPDQVVQESRKKNEFVFKRGSL